MPPAPLRVCVLAVRTLSAPSVRTHIWRPGVLPCIICACRVPPSHLIVTISAYPGDHMITPRAREASTARAHTCRHTGRERVTRARPSGERAHALQRSHHLVLGVVVSMLPWSNATRANSSCVSCTAGSTGGGARRASRTDYSNHKSVL